MRRLISQATVIAGPCVAPIPLTLLVVLVGRWQGYRAHFGFATGEALIAVVSDFAGMLQRAGPLGAALLSVNYIANCGIVIVISLLLSQRWNWSRVACFFTASTGILLVAAIAYPPPMHVSPGIIIKAAAIAPVNSFEDQWSYYWVKYPPLALPVAVASGWMLAMTPMLGWEMRRRLRYGKCPECAYDLQCKFDQGCPECGWNHGTKNRSDAVSNLKLQLSRRRTTMLVLIVWTAMVVTCAIMFQPWIRSVLPTVTDSSLQIRLVSPESGAYSEVHIDMAVQSFTGWFELPGRETKMQWSAAFVRNDETPFSQLTSRSSKGQVLASITGNYTTLATIHVSETEETATLVLNGDEDRHDVPLTELQVKRWMQHVFPGSEAVLLARESAAIMQAVEEWRHPESKRLSPMPTLAGPDRAFSGYGFRGGTGEPRVTWPSLIAVIAGFVVVWLYGCWIVLRQRGLAPSSRAAPGAG